MTQEEFTIAIEDLFALRTKKKAGENLSGAEYKKLEYFRDVLNNFLDAKASGKGITINERIELIAQYEKANDLYLAAEGGELTQPLTPPPVREAPTLSTATDVKLDVKNTEQYIREIAASGKSVEDGTKLGGASQQEGLVNEYSVIPDFIETIKNTIAQEDDGTLKLAVEPVVDNEVVDDVGIVTLAETLKSDVAQLIAEEETLIFTEHPLYVLGKGIYTDLESQLHIFNVKQDTLDPKSIFVDEAINPYDIPETYLGDVQVQLSAAEAVAAEALAQYKEELAVEQAVAIETYSGGG